jgi:hypothetical protein
MSHAIKKIRGVSIDLQPCPFCENPPEWVIVPGDDYIMRCSACHASTKVARWTPEEAAADWNSNKIENDHFTITEDTKIDDYLKQGIKNVLFSEYSIIEPFPVPGGGFLCSSAVIVADKTTIHIEPEKTHLLYDEICGYGHDYYIKPITEEGNKISFVKSKWRKDNLLSVSFCCDGKTTTISSCAKYDCLIVREE